MNRISILDEAGKACKEAIHLEPVDCFVSVNSQVVKPDALPVDCDSVKKDDPLLLTSSDDQKTQAKSSFPSKESNVSEEDQSSTESGKIVGKVTVSATIIPPVVQKSGSKAEDDKNCQDLESQTALLQKMPPLAPIENSDQAPPVTSSSSPQEHSVAMVNI